MNKTNTKRYLYTTALLASTFCFTTPGHTQTLYGALTGVVSDAAGSVIPNAQVTATDPATGLKRTATSDGSGTYQFTDLPPGTYDITITAAGFGASVTKGVPIGANQTRRIDPQLGIGAVTESIDVSSAPPSLQTERADVNYEITSTQVQELPTTSTAGRNFQGLYRLVPGVPPPTENNSQAGNPGRTQAVTANGIVNTVNSTKIDGAAVGYPWLQSIVAYIPPTDSIQSANIVTNSFNAEQGAAGGIAANLIVKSGTNSFHGSAWEYNSIKNFNARQYFTRVSTTPITPKNIYNEFGGNIGGPIIHDKLFFFFGYNRVSLRQFKTGGAMTIAPTAVRTGDFSHTGFNIYDPKTGTANGSGRTTFANNIIPAGRISPAGLKMLSLLPTENQLTAAGAVPSGNYVNGAVLAFDRSAYDAKVSYNPTSKTTFFGRYSVQRSNIVDPPALGAAIGNTWDGGQPGSAPGTIQNIGLGSTHAFTSNFLIDANAGFVRINLAARAPDYGTNYGTDTLGIPGTNGSTPFQSGIPGFLGSAGISSFGNYIQSNPFQFRDAQYVGNLNGTYIKSKHNFRFGGEYVHSAINHLQANNSGARGQFTFTGGSTANNDGTNGPNAYRVIADILLGMPNTVGKTVQSFQPNGPRFSVFSFFAQDTWKATSNLTINYGVRYEFYPFAVRDHTGVFRFDPASDNVLIGGRGNVPTNTGEDVGHGQLVPRFGINYRINEKTVIRSGAGITVDPENYRFFRDSYPALITLNQSGATTYNPVIALNAATTNNTIATGTLNVGIPTVVVPDISPGVIPLPYNYATQTAPQKWRRGYIEAYNLFIDRDIVKDVVLNLGYVGTHHVRQVLGIDINAAGVNTAGNGARPLVSKDIDPATNLPRRYSTTILNVLPAGDEEYSGMQLQVSDRQLRSLQFGYSYTWSHYLNYWDADSTLGTPTFSTPGLYKRNYGTSGFDRTHMNVLWTVYKLPFGKGRQFLNSGLIGSIVGGWDFNSITTYYSGKPFQVTDGSQQGYGDTVVPNLISKPAVTGTHYVTTGGTFPNYIVNNGNYAKLASAAANGNVGRNSVRGPGYFNLDVGLTRNIPIYREIALVFKAESFDVTNTPQWGQPVSDVSNATGFGQIQSVLSTSNRTVRFSGRISF